MLGHQRPWPAVPFTFGGRPQTDRGQGPAQAVQPPGIGLGCCGAPSRQPQGPSIRHRPGPGGKFGASRSTIDQQQPAALTKIGGGQRPNHQFTVAGESDPHRHQGRTSGSGGLTGDPQLLRITHRPLDPQLTSAEHQTHIGRAAIEHRSRDLDRSPRRRQLKNFPDVTHTY
ncbi:hypothetical protein ACFVJH_17635 [Streptomyces decoyicus]|uniref:hypothetical protein n=1 Tax=Streptomyces decoyicus TaxID=249567 RepID=UPI00362FD9A7